MTGCAMLVGCAARVGFAACVGCAARPRLTGSKCLVAPGATGLGPKTMCGGCTGPANAAVERANAATPPHAPRIALTCLMLVAFLRDGW